jgi:hypothetical protein
MGQESYSIFHPIVVQSIKMVKRKIQNKQKTKSKTQIKIKAQTVPVSKPTSLHEAYLSP